MIDLIIIVIIMLSAVIGYFRGLIKTLMQLVSSVLSLIISFVIYKPVAYLLKLSPIYTGIKEWVFEKMGEADLLGLGAQSQAKEISNLTSWMPGFIGSQIAKNNNNEVYTLLGVNNIIDYIVTYIANIAIMGIALMVTWLLVKIIITTIMKTLDIVAKLPVISTFNKWGGLIAGIFKAVLGVWIVMLLIPFLSSLKAMPDLQMLIDSNILAKIIYDNNLILFYLNKLVL